MAGQPSRPRNKGLICLIAGHIQEDQRFISPYFWEGWVRGGRLTSLDPLLFEKTPLLAGPSSGCKW